ncbi:AraC family transcriptional regulator [uncultured Chitinophaga sp.]|jgi:AraC-type DNA-binding domain-containing proteins|uniref:AraC family transcriptional regulator n=1 Tax=uncultured Chitinophaga sp. TaxID=339340 RepID=UPI00260B09E7|nr:AraC family transcriptional regulator [uncultured Chitinophaga sp.]
MKHLQTGEFYGNTNKTIDLNGVVLTDTEYTHDKVDWHYHENAYFTFILQGNVIEGNKKEIYTCSAGSLLYHNWQDPHYNIKPEGFTRGFHIELKDSWFKNFSFNSDALQGSINIRNPDAKFLLYRIFKETKTWDDVSALEIQSRLLQVLAMMYDDSRSAHPVKPLWAVKVGEMLRDDLAQSYRLDELASALGIHPVHLSRHFPRYFHCGLAEYVRKLRVEKSLTLLANKKLSLTEVAFECGFSDQSHFNRCFKDIMGLTPFSFRKSLHS